VCFCTCLSATAALLHFCTSCLIAAATRPRQSATCVSFSLAPPSFPPFVPISSRSLPSLPSLYLIVPREVHPITHTPASHSLLPILVSFPLRNSLVFALSTRRQATSFSHSAFIVAAPSLSLSSSPHPRSYSSFASSCAAPHPALDRFGPHRTIDHGSLFDIASSLRKGSTHVKHGFNPSLANGLLLLRTSDAAFHSSSALKLLSRIGQASQEIFFRCSRRYTSLHRLGRACPSFRSSVSGRTGSIALL
jgi:hypothetical protein